MFTQPQSGLWIPERSCVLAVKCYQKALVIGGHSVTLQGLFKTKCCCSLIELDEVFDRKSIKRDGAVRQLQSAEGSRIGAFYIVVQTQYGKWEENPSSVTTAAINTRSGHSSHSSLNRYREESVVKVNKIAKYTLQITSGTGQTTHQVCSYGCYVVAPGKWNPKNRHCSFSYFSWPLMKFKWQPTNLRQILHF